MYLFIHLIKILYLCNRNQNKMKMIGTISVSDAYMEMLGTLPNEDKLDLIQGLELDNWK